MGFRTVHTRKTVEKMISWCENFPMVTIDVPHCPEDNGTLPKDPLEAVEDENELIRIKSD